MRVLGIEKQSVFNPEDATVDKIYVVMQSDRNISLVTRERYNSGPFHTTCCKYAGPGISSSFTNGNGWDWAVSESLVELLKKTQQRELVAYEFVTFLEFCEWFVEYTDPEKNERDSSRQAA